MGSDTCEVKRREIPKNITTTRDIDIEIKLVKRLSVQQQKWSSSQAVIKFTGKTRITLKFQVAVILKAKNAYNVVIS